MVHAEAFSRPLSRNEVVGLIFRLTIFGAVTYFTIKWMVDAIDPTRKQKVEAQKQAEKLMKQIGVKNVKLTEYEMSIAAHLVDPLSMHVTWSDIAGLDDVITDLKDTVILPIKKKYLFENSRLLQPPKGVLLYGPPGCGKTLIAKATAKEAGCRFINLQPSTLTDKWYGESQKLAAAVFSLAIKLQPSIIFIDEIDSFLRNRSSTDHEATAMMKAQFMSLWDGLDTDYSCQVIVMGATNRPQDLDSAIMRRMPTRFHINQPALKQREAILKLILKNENVDSHVDLLQVAKETDGFSGSDLKEMCRDAALLCVREYVNSACQEDVYVGCCTSPRLTAAAAGAELACRVSHRALACLAAHLPLYTPPALLLLLLLALKMSSVLLGHPSGVCHACSNPGCIQGLERGQGREGSWGRGWSPRSG
uniref:Outer mitochondrial transmembrane helix translocase n=1 Tax=Taeniopygia guttata TaxID=59729 RepID=H0Z3L3_TAEGU